MSTFDRKVAFQVIWPGEYKPLSIPVLQNPMLSLANKIVNPPVIKRNKSVRNYIFFSNVYPRLKNPLVISLAIHGIVLLAGLLAPKDHPVENQFTIELVQTPEEMSVKSFTRVSSVKDQTPQAQSKRTRNSLLQADPGSLRDQPPQDKTNPFDKTDDTFAKEYENTLFNRKNTASNETAAKRTQNDRQNDRRGKLKWDEDKADISHEEKTQVAEKVPMGRGQSKTIQWSDGYARKLTFQPDIEYPLYFRKQGIQASVKLIIDVDAAGNVVNAEVLQTSGYSRLDILARSGVMKARFVRRDDATRSLDRGVVEVQYRLER